MVSFAVSFARETWSLYGVGVLAVILRLIARVRRLSIRGLQGDDALMIFALLWYTILCVSLNEVASGGGSNLMTQEDIDNLTDETRTERIRGSKWVFVSEHAFVLTIWSLKFCMLCIYVRITEGLTQRNLVIMAASYTGLCLLGTELALFLSCRPLANYWAVPTPDYQCSSYQHYEIANGAMSISSDIFILVVAMPILMAVRLPKRQKLVLLLLFGLGGFVIIAAVLTKIYCLVPSLISYVYMNWYFREATVAMLVTNLPLSWSLLRDIFPGLKKWANGGESDFIPDSWPKSSRTQSTAKRRGRDLMLDSFDRTQWDEKEFDTNNTSESREGIVSDHAVEEHGNIHVKSDVTVNVEEGQGEVSKVWDWNGNPHHVSTTHISSSETATGAGRH